jgi:hypothetical protein
MFSITDAGTVTQIQKFGLLKFQEAMHVSGVRVFAMTSSGLPVRAVPACLPVRIFG